MTRPDHDTAIQLVGWAYAVLVGKAERIAIPGVGRVYRQGFGVVIEPAGTGSTAPASVQQTEEA